LGGAVYQINIVIGTILGSLLAEGSVTYLYFADRLVQFPLGVFAIAAATAILPSLSRQAAAEDFEALSDTFVHALKLVFFISIPAMVGLIVLREPIVALLFQRGEFDQSATRLTAQALLYYSLGLWAFSAVRIVAATLHFNNYQYYPGSGSDEAACSRRTCSGNIAGFHVKSGASDSRIEN